MPDWNQVYLSQEVEQQTPADVLTHNAHLLPESGAVADYACGLGGNACWLAHRGYDVTAWDKSEIAIRKIQQYCDQFGLKVNAEVRDLEQNPPSEEYFDVVVVSFFLHRETLENLNLILKPGGLLFYQTFSGEQRNGVGPSNANFRLKPGELLDAFSDMKILYYREEGDYGDKDEGKPDQALLVAAKPR